MKCIFCKCDSSNSKSVEHIVPESLGNKSNFLPKGVVCDKCNNYFALKIEKKVLEIKYFTQLRHRNGIESKKGKIPRGKARVPITNFEGEVIIHKNNLNEIIIDTKSFELIKEGKVNHLILPFDKRPPLGNRYVSRFLAKIALEMMASRVLEVFPNDQNKFADEISLDPLRNYARYNPKNENWIYSVRKIYEEDEKFYTEDGNCLDVIFESAFLQTDEMEMYFIIAFKGVEFVINTAGSSIYGYEKWLKNNDNISPLYSEGKRFKNKLTPNFKINKKK